MLILSAHFLIPAGTHGCTRQGVPACSVKLSSPAPIIQAMKQLKSENEKLAAENRVFQVLKCMGAIEVRISDTASAAARIDLRGRARLDA
jgi:hypothetical protein